MSNPVAVKMVLGQVSEENFRLNESQVVVRAPCSQLTELS